jgi:hypothetical protein
MTASNTITLNGKKLFVLALAWLIAGAIILALSLAQSEQQTLVSKALLTVVGLFQASFFLDSSKTRGKNLLALSGLLMAVVGILLLGMGGLTGSPIIRILISIWVIAAMVFSSFTIANLAFQLPEGMRTAARLAAIAAGVLAFAVVFFVAHNLIGGILIAAFFIASGFAVLKISQAVLPSRGENA